MNFKVSLHDFSVTEVGSFNMLAHHRWNGQHYQLPGFALIEVRTDTLPGNLTELSLFHPETTANNGHVDLYYRPDLAAQGKCPFARYHGRKTVSLREINRDCLWPGGPLSLLNVVKAVERRIYSPDSYSWLNYWLINLEDPRMNSNTDSDWEYGLGNKQSRRVSSIPADEVWTVKPDPKTGVSSVGLEEKTS